MDTTKEITQYIDEIYANLCTEEDKLLAKQEKSGLRFLRYWKDKLEEENPRLFWYTINIQLPYWTHWIKKYKTKTHGMQIYLENIWEKYKYLKKHGDTETLSTLF